jgi:recombination protein RecT
MATSTPSTQLAKKPIDGIRSLLMQAEKQIALALPKHMTAERMIRVALTTIQRTPRLMECTPLSIVGSVIQASEMGLELNGFLGEAYLVPFWNSKTRSYEAQFQVGYRGLISLARRSGQVSLIRSELVYDCDHFNVRYGLDMDLEHEPDLENPDRGTKDKDGNMVGLRGAYAVVKFKDGEFDFEYLPLSKLNELRARSKSRDRDGNESGPWVTDPDQMYRKVPIRQLAKRLPLSPEFQKAAVLDEYGEAGVRQHLSAEVTENPAFSNVLAEVAQNTAQALAEKYISKPEPETITVTQETAQVAKRQTQQEDGPPLELYDEVASQQPDPISASTASANQQPPLGADFNPFDQQPNGFEPRTTRRGHR